MNDNHAGDDLNRFTDKAYAEMSVWEDSDGDSDPETSDSVTTCHLSIVALAVIFGGVAYWLGWAHV